MRGLYARNRVYEGITGRESFAPWLGRLEQRITDKIILSILQELPPEWYDDDLDTLLALAEKLYRRREYVVELLVEAKNTSRQPFPNWI